MRTPFDILLRSMSARSVANAGTEDLRSGINYLAPQFSGVDFFRENSDWCASIRNGREVAIGVAFPLEHVARSKSPACRATRFALLSSRRSTRPHLAITKCSRLLDYLCLVALGHSLPSLGSLPRNLNPITDRFKSRPTQSDLHSRVNRDEDTPLYFDLQGPLHTNLRLESSEPPQLERFVLARLNAVPRVRIFTPQSATATSSDADRLPVLRARSLASVSVVAHIAARAAEQIQRRRS